MLIGELRILADNNFIYYARLDGSILKTSGEAIQVSQFQDHICIVSSVF